MCQWDIMTSVKNLAHKLQLIFYINEVYYILQVLYIRVCLLDKKYISLHSFIHKSAYHHV